MLRSRREGLRVPTEVRSAKDLVADALRLHREGDFAAAEALYARVLEETPASDRNDAARADALHLLGLIYSRRGDLPGAIALIERAIEANPRFSAYHNNLGNLHTRAGDAAAAERCYRRAIAVDAANADAHLNLGKLLQQAGDLAASRRFLTKALGLAPGSVEAQMSLGRLEEAEGNQPAALARFREAARLSPAEPAPHMMLGRALTSAGRLDEAEASLRRAAALDPMDADAYYNLGVLAYKRDRWVEAGALYRKAIELAPAAPAAADAWNNLGVTLSRQGERQAALAAYLKATELRPDFAGAFHNLGKEALKLGAEQAAERYFRRAIELDPGNSAALHDLGALQQAQGLLEQAAASYRRALAAADQDPQNQGGQRSPAWMELAMNLEGLLALTGDRGAVDRLGALVAARPDFPEGRFNWSMALLLHREFEAGWREYEFRRRVAWLSHNYRPPEATPQPLWDGTPLAGRTLLLHAEQGFGDTLQMVRYLPQVAGRGGRVLLEVQPALRRLLQDLPGVDACIAAGEPVPPFDTYLPLMSLPLVFGTRPDTIPPPLPPPVPAFDGAPGSCRVGLVWAGNPGHSRDRLRSLSLEQLRPLAAIDGVTFTSLQTGPAAVQAARPGAPFRFAADCSHVRDFADTAALVAGLDLVVTIDSAVAHLAGSLGKPVWILLADAPDWRWGLGTRESPWYPTARLFRQQHSLAWAPVIAEATACLAEFAALRMTEVTQPR